MDDVGTEDEDTGVQLEDMGDTPGTDSGMRDAGYGDDVTTLGDVSSETMLDHPCGDALVEDWPLNAAVSDGAVTSSTDGDVMTLEVDASAAGPRMSADSPFVYVDLSSGQKVELDDVSAYSDTSWDLAFKRFIIRSNGGDSGEGDVSVTKVANTTFEAVTSAPMGATYEQDVSYDDCQPLTGPARSLMTAFHYLNTGKDSSNWYEYPALEPTDGEIYIIDVPEEGATYKMEIVSWDSGVFTLEISSL